MGWLDRLIGRKPPILRYGIKECLAEESTLRVRLNKLADDGARVVSFVPQPNGKVLLIWEYARDASRT